MTLMIMMALFARGWLCEGLNLGLGVRLKDGVSLLYVFTNVPDALEEAAISLDIFQLICHSVFADEKRPKGASSYAIAHRDTVVSC